MNKSQRTLRILILGLLCAIGPFSIDMYLPGFPAMAESLSTSVEAVSYSLSSYFIGLCIGQLAYGPLLDRFGRKPPLYAGLSIYVLASVGCSLCTSVEMLIFFRLLQALGGCVGSVAPSAIVRDTFPVNENAKIFSLLILVLGVSPIVAPTFGSFMIVAFGWQSVFIVLALITTTLLIAVYFLLPESRPADPGISLGPAAIAGGFLFVLKDKQFMTYALAGAIAAAGLFAYLAGSPYVFMSIFKVSDKEYGWIFALIAAGLITSSQLNNLLLRRFSSQQIIKTVMIIQSTVGLVLFAGSASGLLNLFGTILLIFLFLSCQGFTFPNSSALSLAPFTREAGTAAALMGSLQMGIGALASALVGMLSNGSTLPMTGIMAVCACGGLAVLLLGRRQLRHQARLRDVEAQALDQVEKF